MSKNAVFFFYKQKMSHNLFADIDLEWALLFHEIWVEPMAYKTEMITVLIVFFALLAFLFYQSAGKKK